MDLSLLISKFFFVGFLTAMSVYYFRKEHIPLPYKLMILFDCLCLSLMAIFGVEVNEIGKLVTNTLGNLFIGVVFLVSGIFFTGNSLMNFPEPELNIKKRFFAYQEVGYGLLVTLIGAILTFISLIQLMTKASK